MTEAQVEERAFELLRRLPRRADADLRMMIDTWLSRYAEADRRAIRQHLPQACLDRFARTNTALGSRQLRRLRAIQQACEVT